MKGKAAAEGKHRRCAVRKGDGRMLQHAAQRSNTLLYGGELHTVKNAQELIAAHTEECVAGGKSCLEHGGKPLQCDIAAVMAVPVVDALQIVHIKHADIKGFLQALFQIFHQIGAVVQAGENIRLRQTQDFHMHPMVGQNDFNVGFNDIKQFFILLRKGVFLYGIKAQDGVQHAVHINRRREGGTEMLAGTLRADFVMVRVERMNVKSLFLLSLVHGNISTVFYRFAGIYLFIVQAMLFLIIK